jgi:hypothetical protein
MKHPASPAGKIIGAVLGCLTGKYAGMLMGMVLMGLVSPKGYAEPFFSAKAILFLTILAGLVGGGFLGAFVGGNPVLAWWSGGTALGLGAVSFVVGIVIWHHDLGPILVMFFVAPLGFVIGAILGMCIGFVIQGARNPSRK